MYYTAKLLYKKIYLLAVVPNEINYTAYFFQKESLTILPVVISANSANSLLLAQRIEQTPPPCTCDTIKRLVLALGGKVTGILIYHYKNGIYYSYIRVEKNGHCYDVDSELLDAVCLATVTKSQILIDSRILIKCGIRITKNLLEKSLIGA
jgi:bifunctional DNase/RNase